MGLGYLNVSSILSTYPESLLTLALCSLQDAFPILQDLARVSSEEASVVFMLGKVYRLMGNHTASMEMFTRARDLNPKLAGAMQNLVVNGTDGSEQEADPDVSRAVVRDNL